MINNNLETIENIFSDLAYIYMGATYTCMTQMSPTSRPNNGGIIEKSNRSMTDLLISCDILHVKKEKEFT